MIIIRATDEQAVVAELEKLLQHIEADVFHSPDENLTSEEWLGIIALNSAKERQYVGRLVRNTEAIAKATQQLAEGLEPVLSYFATELGDAPNAAEERRVALARRVLSQRR